MIEMKQQPIKMLFVFTMSKLVMFTLLCILPSNEVTINFVNVIRLCDVHVGASRSSHLREL